MTKLARIQATIDEGKEAQLKVSELQAFLDHITEGQYKIAITRPVNEEINDDSSARVWWQIWDQPYYGAKTVREAYIEAIYYAQGI